MRLLVTLAWRNLWRNKRRTWITILSVVFAVLLALLLESIDRGSQEVMVNNAVRFSTGYIQLQDTLFNDEPSIDNTLYFDEEIEAQLMAEVPGIANLVPRLEGVVLAAGAERSDIGFLYGVDPDREHAFTGIRDRLNAGSFLSNQPNEAVIGAGMAEYLHLEIGDTLVLLGQGFHGMTAAGRFVISGTVHHPMAEVNNAVVYINLSDAQWFFSAYDRLSGLIVVPERVSRHRDLAERLRASSITHDYRVFTWEELQPELVRTVEFDQAGTLIFLLILYVVIAFGIFGTVLTMTLEREREFGVLISVGMHRRKLAAVVILETLLINFVGVLLGLIVAIPIIGWFWHNPIPLGEDLGSIMEEYGMEAVLKVSIDPQIFYTQGMIVFMISVLIAIYPVLRILSLNVLDAARK